MIPAQRKIHCGYCGHAFREEQAWPRQCRSCEQVSYLNPLPVGVVLVPVDDGLICIRRTIEPARGELALPGGFLEVHETWQEGCARELWEETGLRVAPGDVTLFRADSDTERGVLIVFGLVPPRSSRDLLPFRTNDEVSEFHILNRPHTLGFPLHTRAMQEYFDRRPR
ncbi:MAG: NUDIX domain-containing protein [Gemmataceae bacterium]